jgi:hypothetical protein
MKLHYSVSNCIDYGTVRNLRLHAPTHPHNIRPKCNIPLKFTACKRNVYMHVKCCKCSTQFNITIYLILNKNVHLASVYAWQWLAPSVYAWQWLAPSVYAWQWLAPSVYAWQWLAPSVYARQWLAPSVYAWQWLAPSVLEDKG